MNALFESRLKKQEYYSLKGFLALAFSILTILKAQAQLTGDTSPPYPLYSSNFSLNGSTVSGSGITIAGGSDFFYGVNGQFYNLTIASGSNLFTTYSNSGVNYPSLLTGSSTPNGEVIAISSGKIVNYADLNSYPQGAPHGNGTDNFDRTSGVIYIATNNVNNDVENHGTIGDTSTISSSSNPYYSVAQDDVSGIYMVGGVINNYAGASIQGYNAIFTNGTGTINNYGTVVSSNDGILSGFTINNYFGGVLSGPFSGAHAYSTVNNYGFIASLNNQDYGLLVDGSGNVVNTFGGPVMTGVVNSNGAPVYGGEISSMMSNGTINTSGTLTFDAVMMDGSKETLNLISQNIGGTVYLPDIVGPMIGGYNGDYSSPAARTDNTLNFDFNGISSTDANGLVLAISQSLSGGSYTGSWTDPSTGFVYSWQGFESVNFTGSSLYANAPGIFVNPGAGTTFSYYNSPENYGVTTAGTIETQTVTGTQNLAGTTFITPGWVLQVGSGSLDGVIAQGAGDAIEDDGSLVINNQNTALTLPNSISGSGSLVQEGAAPLTLAANNSYQGGTIIAPGTAVFASGNITEPFGEGTITDNGSIVFETSRSFTVGSPVIGTGSVLLNQSNGTQVTFTGNNTYSGGTTINFGNTFGVGSPNALGAGNVLNEGALVTANGNHVIEVEGNFVQSATGTTFLDIAGLTPASSSPTGARTYEQLVVGGSATLAGKIQLVAFGGFAPGSGNSFAFLSAQGGINVGPVSVVSSQGTTTLPEQGSGGGPLIIDNPFPSLDVSLATDQVSGAVTTPGIVGSQGTGFSTSTTLINVRQGNFATLPENYTPNQRSVATAIDSLDKSSNFSTKTPGLAALVGQLNVMSSSRSNLTSAFAELSPQPLEIFRTIAFNNSVFQSQQVNDYLANLRDGSTGLDTSGFTFSPAGLGSDYAAISNHLYALNPSVSSPGFFSDTCTALLTAAVPAPPPKSPWNSFLSGNVILADSNSTQDLPYSNSTTGSGTGGITYCLNKETQVGGLFSYSYTSANLGDQGSHATIDTYSPALFATYSRKGWFLNGLASYGRNVYSEKRGVSIGTFAGTTRGTPSGNQFSANSSAGYEFHDKSLVFGPILGINYVHFTVDSFTETGYSGADLAISQENDDSLRSNLGGGARYQLLVKGVPITSHLNAGWQHEYLDNSHGITSQFSEAGTGSFTVETSSTSRDSASVDLGVDVSINSCLDCFLDYQTQAGFSDYFSQSLDLGAKLCF